MSFHDHEWYHFGSDLMIPVINFQLAAVKGWQTMTKKDSSSQCHTSTSLIRPIWRIFNGLEATDVIS
jgi:hypothetical protein